MQKLLTFVLVLGFFLGCAATPTALTLEEFSFLQKHFGDSVDYSEVKLYLYDDSEDTRSQAIGNKVYMRVPKEGRDSATFKATLVHEFTHVWQYQNQPVLLALKWARNRVVLGDSEYHYSLIEGYSFLDYGSEQQAQIMKGIAEYKLGLEYKIPLYCDNYYQFPSKDTFIELAYPLLEEMQALAEK